MVAVVDGIVVEVNMEMSIHFDGYNKVRVHNAHLRRFVVVVAVLQPYHGLPDVWRPFRIAAIIAD